MMSCHECSTPLSASGRVLHRHRLLTLLLHTGMSCVLSPAESLGLLNHMETTSPALAP